MFNSIPCHTTVNRDYTNPMSPDYIDPPETHEISEWDLSVTFEEILAERTTHTTPEDIAYYKQEGFDLDEIFVALAKKMVSDYGTDMVMKLDGEVLPEYRGSAQTVAQELIEQWACDVDVIEENGYGKNGLSIIVEIESEIPEECPW